MNDILYQLCRHNVSIMGGWYPFPACLIAEHLNLTTNQARYRLRKLKQLGLVESCCELLGDEDDGYFPYHGWRITNKAKKQKNTKRLGKKKEPYVRSVLIWI